MLHLFTEIDKELNFCLFRTRVFDVFIGDSKSFPKAFFDKVYVVFVDPFELLVYLFFYPFDITRLIDRLKKQVGEQLLVLLLVFC